MTPVVPHLVGAHLAALMVVAGGDVASALDCKKARTSVETAICGDPKLLAADAALGRLYFETLRALSGPRHDLLIDDQRRWLKDGRTDQCDAAGSALAPCLAKNLAARQQAITACFAGKPATGSSVQCTVYLHVGCPSVTATVSADLLAHPWLVEKVTANLRQSPGDGDCSPESADSPGTPDQNETSVTATRLATRPNLVTVRTEEDAMWRGAAHPQHDESVDAYDTRTHETIPVSKLLPALKPDTPLLARISKAAAPTLDPSCCFDSPSNPFDHTFGGLGLGTEQPMPSGWSVAPNGDLVLAYDYLAMGRSFVATATLPRKLVIGDVAPAYAGLFVPEGEPAKAAP